MASLCSIRFRRTISLSLIALTVTKSVIECFLTPAQLSALTPMNDPLCISAVRNVMKQMRLDPDEITSIKLYIGSQNRCIGSRFSYPYAAIELEPRVVLGLFDASVDFLDSNSCDALLLGRAFRQGPLSPFDLSLVRRPSSLECRGIVGHEIAHYKLNHCLKAALLPSWLLLSSLTYVYFPKASVFPLFAYAYALHSFHQSSELEADACVAETLGPLVAGALIFRHQLKLTAEKPHSGTLVRWVQKDLPVWLFHVSPEKRIENLKKFL